MLHGCYWCRNKQVWVFYYWEQKRKKKINLTLLFGKLKPKLGHSRTVLGPGNRNNPAELKWSSSVTTNVYRVGERRWGDHSFFGVSNTGVMQGEVQSQVSSLFILLIASITHIDSLIWMCLQPWYLWISPTETLISLLRNTHLAVLSRWLSNNLY